MNCSTLKNGWWKPSVSAYSPIIKILISEVLGRVENASKAGKTLSHATIKYFGQFWDGIIGKYQKQVKLEM